MFYTTRTISRWFAGITLCLFTSLACSKGGDSPNTPNACAGVTVNITAAIANASPGQSNGKIEASAAGGSGSVSFSLNGGAFQISGVFNNLAKGSYSITAKYTNGCTGAANFQVNETDPCANTITVTATSTSSDPCNAGGTVTLTATGSAGFTYSINNVTFQSSNVFENVAVGSYTASAKDNTGCSKATTITVSPVATGPLFQSVRALVTANCAISGCHAGTQSPNFTVDCNIIINKALIKARAVDGTPSFMPPTGPLPITERNKISEWINAGGRFTD